ncbi:MAG: hypothetical protein ACRCZD_08990 [Phycicoccus sp.]
MSDLSVGVLPVLLALGVGALSALVPVVNAEAFLVASVATVNGTGMRVALVVALAGGQAVGKVAFFLAARRGRSIRAGHRTRAGRSRRVPSPSTSSFRRRAGDLGTRSLALLDRRAPAAGVVLASASVGVPPLAVTSVAAGIRRTPLSLFLGCALAGRVARFGALAVPVALAR